MSLNTKTMELTIHQRLKKFVDYKKLSKTEFGKPFRASRQEVSNWCAGTKMNVYRIGEMLEKYPELNGHWFLTGDGNMLNNGDASNEKLNICRNPECLIENGKLRNKIEELNARVIELQQEKIEWLKGRL